MAARNALALVAGIGAAVAVDRFVPIKVDGYYRSTAHSEQALDDAARALVQVRAAERDSQSGDAAARREREKEQEIAQFRLQWEDTKRKAEAEGRDPTAHLGLSAKKSAQKGAAGATS